MDACEEYENMVEEKSPTPSSRKRYTILLFVGIIAVYGIIMINGTYASGNSQPQICEAEINQSYENGFTDGLKNQTIEINNYIVQSLQIQGFINYPLIVNNSSGIVRLVMVQ